MHRIMLALAGAAALATPATAQDAYMSPMDFSTQTQVLTSSTIGNISVGETARRGGGGSGAMRGARQASGGAALAFAPGRVSDARLPYVSTRASQQKALNDYIARASAKNPVAARTIGAELRGRDVTGDLRRELRPYGLDPNDAADIMTAFLVSGHDVMTGGDATPAQVRGVRRQVAGQLAANPAMRNPATRTAFAEELKISTYIVGASAGSAKRDGTLGQFRQGLSRYYRGVTGENIGAWRITSAGFQR